MAPHNRVVAVVAICVALALVVVIVIIVSPSRHTIDIDDYLNGHARGMILPIDEIRVNVDVTACGPSLQSLDGEIKQYYVCVAGYSRYLYSTFPVELGPQTLVLRGVEPIIVVGTP